MSDEFDEWGWWWLSENEDEREKGVSGRCDICGTLSEDLVKCENCDSWVCEECRDLAENICTNCQGFEDEDLEYARAQTEYDTARVEDYVTDTWYEIYERDMKEEKKEIERQMMDVNDIDCKELKLALNEYMRGKYGRINEVFFKSISNSVRERGYLKYIDLFCIFCWKLWSYQKPLDRAFHFMVKNHEDGKDVQTITREAIELAEKGRVRDSVKKLTEPPTKLHGVRVSVASAILTFYDPQKYGVIDKYACKALYGKMIQNPTAEQYQNYLEDLRKLARKCEMKTHDVDAALYIIGHR